MSCIPATRTFSTLRIRKTRTPGWRAILESGTSRTIFARSWALISLATTIPPLVWCHRPLPRASQAPPKRNREPVPIARNVSIEEVHKPNLIKYYGKVASNLTSRTIFTREDGLGIGPDCTVLRPDLPAVRMRRSQSPSPARGRIFHVPRGCTRTGLHGRRGHGRVGERAVYEEVVCDLMIVTELRSDYMRDTRRLLFPFGRCMAFPAA